MKKYFHILFFFSLMFYFSKWSYSQCLTNFYPSPYPAATFSPTCTGANQNITTTGYAGEYSNVSVVSGNTYTFSSSVGTDYITISTTAPAALAWGTTPVVWVATFTGTVRFYTHTNSGCGNAAVNRTRRVSCTAPPGPCFNIAYASPYPAATFNPVCTGGNQDILCNGYAGEYSNVSVVSGNSYTFSSSVGTDWITISTTAPASLAFGTTPVVWVATFTGTIRFYTHTNSSCGTAGVNRCRRVSCTCPASSAPTATAATAITSTSFSANWTASAGATTYFLDVNTNNTFTGTWILNNANVGNVVTYNVAGLTCNTTYYYRVRANNGCSTSTNSNTITVTSSATPCPVTYLHPTVGIANEFVGSCQVATSLGTYYDDGGAAGNYSNDIGFDNACFPFSCPQGIYRIFCPNAVGNCITATFSSFDTESGYDIFTVTNGSTQNSPVLWTGSGTGPIGPFTGTINGCLGFRFYSDGIGTRAGWAATLTMAPCAGGPNGTDNNDCSNTTLICSNIAVPGNSTGPGISAEACGGAAGCPAGGENYSNWYSVSFVTSGTFNFTIVPAVGTDDYDYAVYGPGVTCGALGNSIRCSDAALTGNTGLNAASVDFTEDVTGNKFTAQMNVLAGETYYIMVDEWTPTGAGYNLNLGGTATISCVPLPVKLLSFNATYDVEIRVVNLDWITETEINNDYFAIERSLDGSNFEQIGVVKGSGNSSFTRYYFSTDKDPYPGEINYYRLKQVDFNGNFEYSIISAVVINDPLSKFSVYPNPATESATILFHTPNNTDYRLNIYDYTAKLILSDNFKSEKGKNLIPLDLNGFSQGVYFINLQGNGEMLKTTFIKK